MASPTDAETAKRQSEVIEWLNGLFPDFNTPPNASEEELRARLLSSTVLCAILRRLSPGNIEETRIGAETVKKFISAMERMGLPSFKVSDIEQGRISAVVLCLLSLRDHLNCDSVEDKDTNSPTRYASEARRRWKLLEGNRMQAINILRGQNTYSVPNSPVSGEERRQSFADVVRGDSGPNSPVFVRGDAAQSGPNSPTVSDERRQGFAEQRFQRVLRSPVMSESTSALPHHAGHKFHEVFQLKQGRYCDLPAAKISEMMKSNSLDNAPTQSLLSVVNGILDESVERKNGEIPHRVACLLRKVVQEIERRISTQAEHIRNQNNLIKAREEKYQSRIRVLETLASGTSEETQITMNQLQQTKTERTKVEERKKVEEEDMLRLMKEKENCDHIISKLKQDIQKTNNSYQEQCQQLETKANSYQEQCQQLETKARGTKAELEQRIKEFEILLEESRKRTKELETISQSKFQNWNQQKHIFNNSINLQLRSLKDLRLSSESIKNEALMAQVKCSEEIASFGQRLKVLTNAAEKYHTTLAENRRLYNEVQELKGNIRVYCRIRPFLPGENQKLTTVDNIGENGELGLANPSKQGRDASKMFKFNKVFGPAATQEEIFLDTQPLIRSVLDGYNVCIFAYGQTGSGKTYTMIGPNSATEKEWGVNYRALNDLFHISRNRTDTFLYEVGVQMIEIYNEQVRDLLSNNGSQKRLGILNTSQANGLAVPDATMYPVESTYDVLELMRIGLTNRAMSATALNERSSRSHSIVTVHVRGEDLKTGTTFRGSLHLVDLAGSERVDRSEVTGDRLKEAQHINKSLSALGDVIFSLSQKSTHVPYRNSKLTQVLQSSLGGHAKTLMFVQVNPDVGSYSETLSTLKFAERVSGVELGAARSQKEGKDVRDLMEQVASLKDTIARQDEEIEQLQLLKDIKTQSPGANGERRGSRPIKHSSSLPGMATLSKTTQQGRSLPGKRLATSNSKATSDPENCSDNSDKHSEASSHQSADDFRRQKETMRHSKLAEGDTGQSSADLELMSFGDADSEERLSDISDGGLSMGTETDGSSSVVEFSLFPDKPSQAMKEKTPKASTRIARPTLQKPGQTTPTRPKLKDSLKSSSKSPRSPSLRHSTTSQTPASSVKSARLWQ